VYQNYIISKEKESVDKLHISRKLTKLVRIIYDTCKRVGIDPDIGISSKFPVNFTNCFYYIEVPIDFKMPSEFLDEIRLLASYID
jgi:hypothetical protein